MSLIDDADTIPISSLLAMLYRIPADSTADGRIKEEIIRKRSLTSVLSFVIVVNFSAAADSLAPNSNWSCRGVVH